MYQTLWKITLILKGLIFTVQENASEFGQEKTNTPRSQTTDFSKVNLIQIVTSRYILLTIDLKSKLIFTK